MKNRIVILGVFLALGFGAQAQKYFTRDARVQFNSDTPVEKIEAVNKSGTSVLDTKTGRMDWKVLIKNFLFEKALMQEHFNENYLESTKYPNATFKGSITNLSEVNFAKDGTYKVTAKGTMTIHGIEQEITVPGTLTIGGGAVKVAADFVVKPADYKIDIPGVVRDNIAKEIAVTIDASLKPMGK